MVKNILFLPLVFLLYSVSLAQEGIGSLITPGELASPHAKYEGIKNCTECHELGKGVPDEKCLDCHDKLADKMRNKKGSHASYADPCIKCHSDHKGRKYKMIILDKNGYDHDITGYPLKEKHRVDCTKCHKKEGKYTGLSSECISCHKDVHKGALDKDCGKCHNFKGWKEIERFDHERDSKYSLTGKHGDVKCIKCHENNKFKIDNFEECVTCHKDPHKGKPLCKDCHTTESWKKVKTDHSKTRYPLEDKHTQVRCEKCHKNSQLKGIPFNTCESSYCHSNAHKKQFPGKSCDSCHNIKGWKPSLFKHEAPEYKGYKLEGKHVDTGCEKCHADGRFKPLNYKSCDTSDCHKDAHKGQFRRDKCDSCHNVKGWKPSLFKHEAPEYKGYKLEGKHLDTKCDKCHADGQYKPLSSKCIDCHRKDDVHKNELGNVCDKCHDTREWKKYSLNHNTQTKFPLIGKHVDTKCEKCHDKKKYRTNAVKCTDCHKDKDVHKGKFKEECSACHTQIDWIPRKFDHKNKAGLELKGVHNDILCISCHRTKDEYKGAYRLCNQCHADPHLNQFGSLACTDCHSENSWNPVRFDHSGTGFPLIGRHRLAECKECHANRVYRNTPVACATCHISQKPASHLSLGYGNACEDCHRSMTSWSSYTHPPVTTSCSTCHLAMMPASHTSNPTKYPTTCEICHKSTTAWTSHIHPSVTNGCATCHIAQKPASHTTNGYEDVCENCHRSTVAWSYSHTSTSGCSACHASISPPAHITYASRFGPACENCHKYPTWPTRTFNHSFSPFPITHEGAFYCSDCHGAQNYGNSGGCIECHSSRGVKVHKVTVNSGCLSCHPLGTWP